MDAQSLQVAVDFFFDARTSTRLIADAVTAGQHINYWSPADMARLDQRALIIKELQKLSDREMEHEELVSRIASTLNRSTDDELRSIDPTELAEAVSVR